MRSKSGNDCCVTMAVSSHVQGRPSGLSDCAAAKTLFLAESFRDFLKVMQQNFALMFYADEPDEADRASGVALNGDEDF